MRFFHCKKEVRVVSLVCKESGGFMKKEIFFENTNYDMCYEVFTPDRFRPGLPLITYLHGAGERGKNIDHLKRHAIPRLIEENGLEIDAVVLCPQCPADVVWDNIPFEIKYIIDLVCQHYQCDTSKLTVTGSSMGGFGTFMMGLTFPNVFAGLAPVAGGGMAWRASNLKTTPVMAYHGELDTGVLPQNSIWMVDAVNANGGHAELEIVKGYGHNDGINHVYEEGKIIEWLLKQKRTDFTPVPEAQSKHF